MSTTTLSPLAATDAGAGEPALLLIPGWCGDRSVFDPVIERAASGRRVVAVDLPDHGASPEIGDYDTDTLVEHLLATIEARGLGRVVPVALSHAAWAAVELRRRLGPQAVPGVVLLDWMVLGTPPGFADALAGLQSPAWQDVRRGLFGMWTTGVAVPALHAYVAAMGEYGEAHWRRAGREIAAGFAAYPRPLDALDALQPCPTLHLYAQPADDVILRAQQQYAAEHPWFAVVRLQARSHFPMFEVPDAMAAAIEEFVASLR